MQAMFWKHSTLYFKGVYQDFINLAETRMEGEMIALLHMFVLKHTIQSATTSPEFCDLKMCHNLLFVLMDKQL